MLSTVPEQILEQIDVATDKTDSRRRGVAAGAASGGLLAIGASFLPWIHTDTDDGGSTAITGWGGITGSSSIAGTNLNDVLDGVGTYRPGVVGVVFGSITVVAAIAIAGVSKGQRPHRITASVLMLAGLICIGWGLYRGLDPGDAGVFEAGEASAGLGPWLTAVGGVITAAAAAMIFAGVIDPALRGGVRRGIQPGSR
jgi:hypothetical protein